MIFNKKVQDSILCVGNFDSATGYAWRLIEELWTIVADVGNEKALSTIVCYPSITEINPKLVKAGISVDKYYIARRGIKACGHSFNYLKANKVKYLYLTDRAVFSWCYLVYRLAGVKKIIVHDHTPGYRPPVVGFKKAIKSIINRLPWITVDLAIGVSPYVSERLKVVNCVPQRKIQCVTNGIKDSAHIKDYSTARTNIVRIVTVGRITHYKGIDFAIRTIHLLVTTFGITNILYEVIGDGFDLEEFKALAKTLGVDDYVKFLGKRSGIEALLPTYDIAFHPSKGEAMCLAIVEYMRSGLPVIVSTNPSVNSILKEGEDSLFYSEDQLADCGLKLREAIQSQSVRCKLGLTARKRYVENYSEGAMILQFKKALENILT